MPDARPSPRRHARPRRRATLSLLCLLACAGPAGVARGAPPDAAVAAPPAAGTIDNHDSAVAAEMKGEIRRRLAGGESADAILAAFVARYGPRVLAEPPARGLNVLVYLLPVLALLGGGALVIVFLRRQVRGGAAPAPAGVASPPPAGPPPGDDPYARRVEAALRHPGR